MKKLYIWLVNFRMVILREDDHLYIQHKQSLIRETMTIPAIISNTTLSLLHK